MPARSWVLDGVRISEAERAEIKRALTRYDFTVVEPDPKRGKGEFDFWK